MQLRRFRYRAAAVASESTRTKLSSLRTASSPSAAWLTRSEKSSAVIVPR